MMWPQITRLSVHKYIHNVTKVMCALYVRCTLSVLQKEWRKVWGARYTLGARYWLENMVSRQYETNHLFHKRAFTTHFLTGVDMERMVAVSIAHRWSHLMKLTWRNKISSICLSTLISGNSLLELIGKYMFHCSTFQLLCCWRLISLQQPKRNNVQLYPCL